VIKLIEAQNVIFVFVAFLVAAALVNALGFEGFESSKYTQKIECRNSGECWIETADFISHGGGWSDFTIYEGEESVNSIKFDDMCLPREGYIRYQGDNGKLIVSCSEQGMVAWHN